MYVATVLGWLFGRSIPVNINETYDDRIVATFENVLMLKMSFVALLIPYACLSNSYHNGHTVCISDLLPLGCYSYTVTVLTTLAIFIHCYIYTSGAAGSGMTSSAVGDDRQSSSASGVMMTVIIALSITLSLLLIGLTIGITIICFRRRRHKRSVHHSYSTCYKCIY